MDTNSLREARRLALQNQLDSMKTQEERNKQGQFATPPELAADILEYAKSLLLPGLQIRFLDPALGTGSFFTALLKAFSSSQIAEAVGYEIDAHYANGASGLWDESYFKICLADFTRSIPPVSEDVKPNLVICNPPYVRHHHLLKAEKQRLRLSVEKAINIKLSEQSGLYCHFLCLSHLWLADNGLAGWLIPSEFLDVNYGERIRTYLRERVTLLRIHRFDPKEAQFSNALVSSAIVWFRKSKPPVSHEVEFTFGGTLKYPRLSSFVSISALGTKSKWTSLSLMIPTARQVLSKVEPFDSTSLHENAVNEQNFDVYKQTSFPDFSGITAAKILPQRTLADLFYIKRGLATGANGYFILNEQQITKNRIPAKFLLPILPNPRLLPFDEVIPDDKGFPLVDHRQFLLACNLREDDVEANHESLWEYLQMGIKTGVNRGYICSHRTPWYSQEKRPACLFLCAYMGRQDSKRGEPFRFILNHSIATASNAYHMLYPKPYLQKALEANPPLATLLWQALRTISQDALINEGRVYGGGLHKIEPRELANVPATSIFALLSNRLPSVIP